jgi:hypothetical protein
MKFYDLLGVAFVTACATSIGSGDDAGISESGTEDAPHDGTLADVSTDAFIDVSSDASSSDADSSSDVGAVDAPSDAPVNKCLGIYCIKGYACCNVLSSTNYGLCESTTCVTTCCQ